MRKPDSYERGRRIVMHDGRVAWDPHPERETGHLGFISGELLVPIDPARFVLRSAA